MPTLELWNFINDCLFILYSSHFFSIFFNQFTSCHTQVINVFSITYPCIQIYVHGKWQYILHFSQTYEKSCEKSYVKLDHTLSFSSLAALLFLRLDYDNIWENISLSITLCSTSNEVLHWTLEISKHLTSSTRLNYSCVRVFL